MKLLKFRISEIAKIEKMSIYWSEALNWKIKGLWGLKLDKSEFEFRICHLRTTVYANYIASLILHPLKCKLRLVNSF